MKLYRSLRLIRTVSALFFIIAVSAVTADIYNLFPETLSQNLMLLQFTPSLLSFLHNAAPGFIFFAVVLISTIIAGRGYCSFICPLGILQDIVIRFRRIVNRRKTFQYTKPYDYLRFTILTLTVITFITSGTFLLAWIDPYSIYTRSASAILKPAIAWISNSIARTLISYDIYTVRSVASGVFSSSTVIISGTVIFLITVASFISGRIYCNTFCPVGSLLGLISKFSVFRISLNSTTCIHCGICEKVCKSSCINHSDCYIDHSRCVSCFDCLDSCPNKSLNFRLATYERQPEESEIKTDYTHEKRGTLSRRVFLAGLLPLPAVIFADGTEKKQKIYFQDISKQKVYSKENYSPPPGSMSVEKFNESCTACLLCTTACPTSVLQPSLSQYGIYGIMQPFMDFNSGYCNYDCVACSEICPTGAINDISVVEKHLIQCGISHFIKENCITYTNGVVCGACSEHCPTKAVNMVPYKNGLVIPKVDEKICIGCGACEFVCPVRPIKAIYVNGNRVHKKAELPAKEKKIILKDNDFPF